MGSDDGWEPQPAELRDGESRDVSAHAARNIAQIRAAERDGYIDHDDADDAVEAMVEKDAGPPAPQSSGDRAEAEFGKTGESIDEVHRRIRRGSRFPELTPEERRRRRDRR